jgi:tagaturonate reductase
MKDEKLSAFVESTLTSEINPFVSDNIEATTVFAESIKSRFLNPYLNHQLTSIALNSISKWRARVLPSFKDYYKQNGKIANNLTIGFSYLMALYSSVEKVGDRYEVKLAKRTIELKDDLPYLEYFADKKCVKAFMQDVSVWGEDLTAYEGFADAVKANIAKIKEGVSLL